MKIAAVTSILLILLSQGWGGTRLMAGSDSLRINGQLSCWTGYNLDRKEGFAGGRFLPELYYLRACNQKMHFDLDFSANLYGAFTYPGIDFEPGQSGLKLYRASARLSSEQWEIRVGLQKISFGQSTLLRPLMWFDGTDPRDPLKLTSGVYGLLGRYYLLNNTNFWIWGLLGNDQGRGWDIIPSLKYKPEIGGRAQRPIWGGEAAVSYHFRQPGSDKPFMPEQLPYNSFRYSEHRFALDGKWTIGPGIWFEYVFRFSPGIPDELYLHEHYLSMGIDYTFGIGNGLHVLTENLLYSGLNSVTMPDTYLNISGFTTSYPISLMDRIMLMSYYTWRSKDLYTFASIQRQYDKLSIHLMVFANPEQAGILPAMEGLSLYSGKGGLLMITYNF